MIHAEDTDMTTTGSAHDQFPDQHPSQTLPVLIRATDGKSKKNRDDKIKLSTLVQPDALDGFFLRYAEVCKLGMSGLKKRNRSKAKEKQKAKKKKLGAGAAADVKKV